MMHIFSFKSEVWLPKAVDVIFAFFADPRNLQILTPRWVHFQILSKDPMVMRTGSVIDYRIRIHGIPWRWQTRIDVWEPPYRFVDIQLRGPYTLWYHEHRFVPDDSGTTCVDRVEYAVPVGAWVERLLVRPDIEKIFEFRREKLEQLFSDSPDQQGDSWNAADSS